MLDWLLTNWHKILVVILAVASVWKYFFTYVRPVTHHERNVTIQLPKEGCVITVKPLSARFDVSHESQSEHPAKDCQPVSQTPGPSAK
jgi:hypothetical protein